MKKVVQILPHDARRWLHSVVRKEWYTSLQEKRVLEAEYTYKPFDETHSIFVHIPKTAGLSVCEALYGNKAGGHSSIRHYEIAFSKKDFSSYFKFAFVRNPWDRLHSAYVFLKKGGLNALDKAFGDTLPDSFETFVLGLTPQAVYSYVHLIPQTVFLCSHAGRELSVDFIGRFENTQKDFNIVRQQVNPAAQMVHLNRTDGRTDYRDAYTPQMAIIVRDLYARDVEVLGYDF
jgi:hypothetical protein